MDCRLRIRSTTGAMRLMIATLVCVFVAWNSTSLLGQAESPQNDLRLAPTPIKQAVPTDSTTILIAQKTEPQTPVVQFGSGQQDQTADHANAETNEGNAESPDEPIQPNAEQAPEQTQFDKDAAFEYLADICKIGPRPSASRGMIKQQKYIQDHFEKIGGKYYSQEFWARSPYDGKQVKLHNLMIRWNPERTKRILICCHHDTRPFADADKKNPRANFIGANDGGSGVALLCELGKHIAAMDGEYGIDFMFFDGEEFVIVRQRDPMFLGSTFFAQKYAQGVPPWKYEQAVLVDMVADKDLQIHLEGNSMHFAPGLTQEIWAVAKQIGVNEFLPKQKQFIRDDHLPLNEIAKIPTCDIIDFDYPNPDAGNVFWHTREDKIENCSAESLGKVGSVVLAWLRQKQKIGPGK